MGQSDLATHVSALIRIPAFKVGHRGIDNAKYFFGYPVSSTAAPACPNVDQPSTARGIENQIASTLISETEQMLDSTHGYIRVGEYQVHDAAYARPRVQ